MAMTPGEQPRIGREVAATRKSRTRNWPAQSTVYDRVESLANYSASMGGQVYGIGKGMTAGRNFLAYFNDKDDKPRLKYNIHVEHGRPKNPKYPHPSKNIIPVGTSLDEICQYYPLHVWSDGLRIFMAENWTAEKIFRLLPEETRNTGAANRPWNYLQQAMGREADKMYEEDDNGPRVILKRKRDDTDSDEEARDGNVEMPVAKQPKLTPQEPMPTTSSMPFTPEYYPAQQANEVAVQTPVPGAAQDVVENNNGQEVVEANTQVDKEDADDEEDDDSDEEIDSSTKASSDSELDGNEYDDDQEETASNDDAFAPVEHDVAVAPTHEYPSEFYQDGFVAPVQNTAEFFAPQPNHVVAQAVPYMEHVLALSEAPNAYASMVYDDTYYCTEPQYYQADDGYYYQVDDGYFSMSPESYYQAEDEYVEYPYYGQEMPYSGY